ncbi:MAG TPA: hypothetical protein VNJ48_09500 [Nocardioides sp.]|nr:hypothetical protein [Nocardioides sp.]HXH78731.1 hypothetical protein [Nocardioides sp.]
MEFFGDLGVAPPSGCCAEDLLLPGGQRDGGLPDLGRWRHLGEVVEQADGERRRDQHVPAVGGADRFEQQVTSRVMA